MTDILKEIKNIANSCWHEEQLADWILHQINNQNIIINGYFAAYLDGYLDTCFPYNNISKITTYALEKGNNPFIDYQIVKSFDDIKWETFNCAKISTPLQIIKDIQTNYTLNKQTHRLGITTILKDIYVSNHHSWNNINLDYTTIPKDDLRDITRSIIKEIEIQEEREAKCYA